MNITTIQSSTPSGAGKVTAKGMGRQRTVRVDHALSVEANHAAAVGTLLAAVATPREKAMLLHPSGGQRVRVESASDAGGKMLWHLNLPAPS